MPPTVRTTPDWSQEPETPPVSPRWMARTQVVEPSSSASREHDEGTDWEAGYWDLSNTPV